VVEGYRALGQVMRAVLPEVYVAFARGTNVVSVRTYVFGRWKGGNLVGLRTVTIET
jgi:hypothetical protein